MSTPVAEHEIAMSERVDSRSRGRRMVAPLLTAGVSIGALGYLYAVDPNEPGHYPLCPTKALFGIDCPGCGCTRAMYSLIHGDIAGAADHNIVMLLAVPFVLVLWVRWVLRAWRGVSPAVSMRALRVRNRTMIIALVAILAFGVVRNFVPYLGSS